MIKGTDKVKEKYTNIITNIAKRIDKTTKRKYNMS